MDKPVEMLQDPRTIEAACWAMNPLDGNPMCYFVGQGISRIECYGESSHYCARPFIAIYRNGEDQPWRRIDASGVMLEYASGERMRGQGTEK